MAAGADDGRDAAGRRRLARRAGLPGGPLLALAVLAWPAPDLSREAHLLLAVFAWTVVYWVTEALPVPVTALMSSVLAVLLGIAPATVVLAAYADPIVFLFIGSFIVAEAMKETGLDRRFALAVLDRAWATRTPARLMLTLGAVTCAISLWVSNTATTAIMLPIGLGVLRALGHAQDGRPTALGVGVLLMLAWSSSVAVGVPVGSPPNLIAIGMLRDLAGRRLTFVDWMAVTMPLTILMLLLCWLILGRRYGGGGATFPHDPRAWLDAERARLGPWTRAQANVSAVFALAVLLWVLPGVVAIVAPAGAAASRFLEARLPESIVALGAAVLLFALPAGGGPTLTWRQAADIDWGTVLLFGGGLALGTLMFATGLAPAIGGAAAHLTGGGLWTLTAAAIVVGVVVSETSSNTASASMVVPVVIAVAEGAGVSPVPPALGAALGASFGFMLPVSTPPNAIIYGSRLVPLGEMIRAGIVLDVAGAALIWLGLRVLCPLLGVI